MISKLCAKVASGGESDRGKFASTEAGIYFNAIIQGESDYKQVLKMHS